MKHIEVKSIDSMLSIKNFKATNVNSLISFYQGGLK